MSTTITHLNPRTQAQEILDTFGVLVSGVGTKPSIASIGLRMAQPRPTVPIIALDALSDPVMPSELEFIRKISELGAAKYCPDGDQEAIKKLIEANKFVGVTCNDNWQYLLKQGSRWFHSWSQWSWNPVPIQPKPQLKYAASQCFCDLGVNQSMVKMRDSDERYEGIILRRYPCYG